MPTAHAAGSAPALPAWFGDPRALAARSLSCLDLTRLNDDDTADDIDRLCARAVGEFGAVAAVCVWPRLAARARQRLPAHVAVAAVANFPHGGADVRAAVADVRAIVDAGAQEVDVVLPYRHLDAAPAWMDAVRKAAGHLRLKVILETGEIGEADAVTRACGIALRGGADMLKTSTGKVRVNATLPAAALLLQAIVADPTACDRVGFKPAGGIRTLADARSYMALTAQRLGEAALTSARLRLGASALLDDLEAVLRGGAGADVSIGY
ncbi:MAG: deoxyribose-phosphate aldolase [Rubrivivax sp.]